MANPITSALLRSMRTYAGQLTKLVKSLAPNHLKGNVKTEVIQNTEGSVRLTVSVKGADAHAQEYGSGLHTDGRKGAKAKYPILPKNKKVLAFHWEIATANPDRFKFLPDGRVMLSRVMHPGIKKYKDRGYVNPAVRELRNRIRQKGSGVKQEVRQAIFGEIRKSFIGANKK